jgi:flagellar motor component MotA
LERGPGWRGEAGLTKPCVVVGVVAAGGGGRRRRYVLSDIDMVVVGGVVAVVVGNGPQVACHPPSVVKVGFSRRQEQRADERTNDGTGDSR